MLLVVVLAEEKIGGAEIETGIGLAIAVEIEEGIRTPSEQGARKGSSNPG